jgi:hypothetical protein
LRREFGPEEGDDRMSIDAHLATGAAVRRRTTRALLVLAVVAALFGLFGAYREAQADTYQELKACLRSAIDTTQPGSWARFVAVLDCYAAWGDQKLSLNLEVDPASTGYDTFAERPRLLIAGEAAVTVDLDILSGDNLEDVDLYLVNDANNPADPNFGVLVGSDASSAGGWSITFDPDDGGVDDWDGVLVAEAHFTGHDLEEDGDMAVIYTTRDSSPSVGGILEDPDVEALPSEAADSGDGLSAGVIAGIAGVAAAAVATAGGGFALWRRRIR